MRPKILTVDDAKVVRRLVEQALAPFDCEVHEAANGYNALFVMEKSLPDLILLDVSMPVMNGIELLEMLRSKDQLKRIPVIMLIAPADRPMLPEFAALDATVTVMKPFNATTLLEAIGRVLPLKPAAK